MPANSPRVTIVLERPLYDTLRRLARSEGSSLSAKARDLLSGALERHEDVVLEKMAAVRERTLDRTRTLSHYAAWGRKR